MRLSWGQRRGRPVDRTDGPDAPSAARQIQKERAEILRLIEKLRDNRRRLEASGDARHAQLRSTIDSLLNAQLARLDGVRAPARSTTAAVAKRSAGPAPKASAVPRGGGAVSVLERLEERLARIEGRLDEGVAAPATKSSASEPEDYTLSGVIQGDMLSDVLQMISSNSMSGIFVIDNDVARFTIRFNEGQIVHAEGLDMSGESAFFAAFAATSGRYLFRELQEAPEKKTIEANTQFLILEALRRIDEEGSEGEGEGG